MSDDGRVAVVAALLRDEWRQRYYDVDEMARTIVETLDQRALVTQWEGERIQLLEEAEDVWIPHQDLLEALNKLPGAPLTMADLRLRMKNVSGGRYGSPFRNGDPSHQAECLRVYRREKKVGSTILAIIQAIRDEALEPAYLRESEEASRRWHEENLALVRSGRDFGFRNMGTQTTYAKYCRHKGQLYRVTRFPTNEYGVFRVNTIDEEGIPAEPPRFHRKIDVIRAFKANTVK